MLLVDKSLHDYSDQPARRGTSLGTSVRTGTRQSIPSHNIDSCAGVRTTAPSCVNGQTNRPRSSRFAYRHSPVPSHQRTLILSARLPRNTNRCPQYGFRLSTSCTIMARPSNPRRMSVAPQATQICAPAGTGIIARRPQAHPQYARRSPVLSALTDAKSGHCAAPPR
jgi:hypothetical protein